MRVRPKDAPAGGVGREETLIADDGQYGEHLERDHSPGEEADLPRQHQASAAQRTPVHLLAHLDAAAGAGPCHRDLRPERRRDRRAPALHWVMMYLDEYVGTTNAAAR